MRCGRFPTISIHFSSILWLVSFLLFKPLSAQKAIPVEPYIAEAQQHYIANWKKSVRTLTHDSADFIGLPYPYSTPTLAGNQMFREMYYWDSYFINCGLLAYGSHPQRDGESTADEKFAIQQAINNCNNLIYLVNKFGFVPNANRFSMTNRSQPPLLGAMINDIFEVTADTAWLRVALKALEKEHHWWMENRSLGLLPQEYQGIDGAQKNPTALRLNHYGNNANDAFLLRFAQFLRGRLGSGFDSMYSKLNNDSIRSPEGKSRTTASLFKIRRSTISKYSFPIFVISSSSKESNFSHSSPKDATVFESTNASFSVTKDAISDDSNEIVLTIF